MTRGELDDMERHAREALAAGGPPELLKSATATMQWRDSIHRTLSLVRLARLGLALDELPTPDRSTVDTIRRYHGPDPDDDAFCRCGCSMPCDAWQLLRWIDDHCENPK